MTGLSARPKQWSWPKTFNLANKSHIELACFFVLDARAANGWERGFLEDIRTRSRLSQKQRDMLLELIDKARRAKRRSEAAAEEAVQ